MIAQGTHSGGPVRPHSLYGGIAQSSFRFLGRESRTGLIRAEPPLPSGELARSRARRNWWARRTLVVVRQRGLVRVCLVLG
jgi:hypothetical protein